MNTFYTKIQLNEGNKMDENITIKYKEDGGYKYTKVCEYMDSLDLNYEVL